MKPKTSLSARKAFLDALQASLNKRRISIKHELASRNDPDWEDLATKRDVYEVLEARATLANHELRQIETRPATARGRNPRHLRQMQHRYRRGQTGRPALHLLLQTLLRNTGHKPGLIHGAVQVAARWSDR
jgi:hypothetical protein